MMRLIDTLLIRYGYSYSISMPSESKSLKRISSAFSMKEFRTTSMISQHYLSFIRIKRSCNLDTAKILIGSNVFVYNVTIVFLGETIVTQNYIE